VPVHHRDGEDPTDERDDGADREVDVAGDDDHDHADGEDHDVGVLLEQARHVVRHEQLAAGEQLEEDDDRDEGTDDAVLAQVGLLGSLASLGGIDRLAGGRRDRCRGVGSWGPVGVTWVIGPPPPSPWS
jgi:hypothetical protein